MSNVIMFKSVIMEIDGVLSTRYAHGEGPIIHTVTGEHSIMCKTVDRQTVDVAMYKCYMTREIAICLLY